MESTKRLYICLPEEQMEFQKSGKWDHGIFVTDLNPLLTDSELHSYFQKFGTITECTMTLDKSSGWPKGVAFVRYTSLEEAEAAQAACPHYFGGFQMQLRKVITPKNRLNTMLKTAQHQSFHANQCVN